VQEGSGEVPGPGSGWFGGLFIRAEVRVYPTRTRDSARMNIGRAAASRIPTLRPRRSAGAGPADPRFSADEDRPCSGLPHPHPSPAPKCGCGTRGPAIRRGWRSALRFARAEVRVRAPRTRDSPRM